MNAANIPRNPAIQAILMMIIGMARRELENLAECPSIIFAFKLMVKKQRPHQKNADLDVSGRVAVKKKHQKTARLRV